MENPDLSGKADEKPKKPLWTAKDLTLEDLAKLPKGPREMMLLNYPTEEIIRLSYIEDLIPPIRELIESPGFWFKLLEQDGFLLPKDILDFAHQWAKKKKTPAQFLRSFYFRFDTSMFDFTSSITELEQLIKRDQKYKPFDQITAKMQELLSEYKAQQAALLPFEETLILLQFSSDIYQLRKRSPVKIHFDIQFVPSDFSVTDVSWTEFAQQVSQLNIEPDEIADAIPDPLSTLPFGQNPISIERIEKAKARRKKQKHERRTKPTPIELSGKKKRTQVYSHPDSEEENEEHKERLSFSIQQPQYALYKQRFIHYLELIRKAAREGDVVRLTTGRYYLYTKEDQLRLKAYSQFLPEEAIPHLKRNDISTIREVNQHYNVHGIEIEGRMIILSNNKEFYLRHADHIFFVDPASGPKPKTKKAADLRCRWLERKPDGKMRRCMGKARSGFFCDQHNRSEGNEEQTQRCREEDEDESQELVLGNFPTVVPNLKGVEAEEIEAEDE